MLLVFCLKGVKITLNKGEMVMPSVKKAKKIVQNAALPDIDMLYISNFLTNEAVRAHVAEYKSKQVPFSFIKFYFNSIRQSDELSKDTIVQKFFNQMYNLDLDIYCFIYYLTFRKDVKKVIEDKKRGYVFVLKNISQPSILNMYINEKGVLASSLKNIQQQSAAFCAQAQHYVRNAYQLYIENYAEYLTLALDREFLEQKKKNAVAIRKSKDSESLVSKAAELPENENKKISRLFIPSLPLPSDYPIGKNRVHSSYHVSTITSMSKQIDLLSKYRINTVKYSKSFVELRIEASKPAQTAAKTRNWDDFF